MIKKIISDIYLFYNSHFPFERGKVFIAKLITRYFGTFKIKNKDGFYFEIFLSSQMDLAYQNISHNNPDLILKEIMSLKPGARFLDIGANIGFYSINASRVIGQEGRVYSFEPSMREYIRLINNITINHIGNIIPYNFALGDSQGELIISVAKDHTGLNRLNTNVEFEIENTQLVHCITLDKFFKDEEVQFDLVKLDVEGAEYLVLLGMSSLLAEKRIRKLIVEITPKYFKQFGYDKETLYQYLAEYSFNPSIMSDDWQYDEIFTLDN